MNPNEVTSSARNSLSIAPRRLTIKPANISATQIGTAGVFSISSGDCADPDIDLAHQRRDEGEELRIEGHDTDAIDRNDGGGDEIFRREQNAP